MAYFAMLEIITGVAVFAFCFVVAGGGSVLVLYLVGTCFFC
jgi:hypothetical protein